MGDLTALAFLPRKRRGKNPAKTTSGAAVRERWEVHFSRFFRYPPAHSTCPDLVPLPTRIRNRSPAGNWVSSSSSSLAMLQLAHDHSSSDVLLTVCFAGRVMEEHYVSKLQYVWPHVSCNPGLPARGTRAVFISYRDCMGEVQKFALRFLSVDEAERFMNSLKAIFDIEPPHTDMGSEISAQSEFTYSTGPPLERVYTDFVMTPAQTYTAQIPPSFGSAAQQYSQAQQMMHIHNFQQNLPVVRPGFTALLNDYHHAVEQARSTASEAVNLNSHVMPPSFTSWLGNSQPVFEQVATQEVISPEANLISQLASYRGDASFQDMLSNMERVISEMGGDLTL
ncbi:hypothetical protein ACFX13_011813 [Malus domestica]